MESDCISSWSLLIFLIKATEQRGTHENCFNIKIQYLFNVMFVLSKICLVKN